jgi:iron complex outermembrane receptor protein
MYKKTKQSQKFNRITSGFIALGLFVIAFPGSTQELQTEISKNDENLEVIQVRGIKSQLTRAVAMKRDNVQFVDAISADDMGKLPDTNVSESLQRISGVQLERGIGEGSTVSIRGLTQNVILVNGRHITSAGGRGDQGPDQKKLKVR